MGIGNAYATVMLHWLKTSTPSGWHDGVFIDYMAQDHHPQEQQEVTEVTRGAGDPMEFAEGETKEVEV